MIEHKVALNLRILVLHFIFASENNFRMIHYNIAFIYIYIYICVCVCEITPHNGLVGR